MSTVSDGEIHTGTGLFESGAVHDEVRNCFARLFAAGAELYLPDIEVCWLTLSLLNFPYSVLGLYLILSDNPDMDLCSAM